MNSYRKSRLLILDIIIKCHQAAIAPSDIPGISSSILEEVEEIASDIAAAIPYHLADNISVFVTQTSASNGTAVDMTPGRSAGGLLLMHTLYMVSTLTVIDPSLKKYFKDCLAWIGRNMGIGQATMLSEVEVINS
jgi:hypothetical protein